MHESAYLAHPASCMCKGGGRERANDLKRDLRVRGRVTNKMARVTQWRREKVIERDRELMMSTVSVFCEATLREVSHQRVHRRCSQPNAATTCGWHIYSSIFTTFAHTIASGAINRFSLFICFQIMCSSRLVPAKQIHFPENVSNPLHTQMSVDT